MDKEFLTVSETAEYFGKTKGTIARYRQKGFIKPYIKGFTVFYKRSELEQMESAPQLFQYKGAKREVTGEPVAA